MKTPAAGSMDMTGQGDRAVLPTPALAGPRPILVIGYGNPLRGDDAVGQLVARAIAGRQLPGVTALAYHQLVPELAEPVAAARAVVFVDAIAAPATPGAGAGPVVVARPVAPGAEPALAVRGHTADPAGLLALARDLFGRAPAAWVVPVPGTDFALGETLSPGARAAAAAAEQLVCELCAAIVAGRSSGGEAR